MKRAEVWRGPDRGWYCLLRPDTTSGVKRSVRISLSGWPDGYVKGDESGPFPTHADALAHALALVGLTPKEKNR